MLENKQQTCCDFKVDGGVLRDVPFRLSQLKKILSRRIDSGASKLLHGPRNYPLRLGKKVTHVVPAHGCSKDSNTLHELMPNDAQGDLKDHIYDCLLVPSLHSLQVDNS